LFDEWHKEHHQATHIHGEHVNLKGVEKSFLLLGTPNVGKSTFFNKTTTATAEVSNVDRMTVRDTIGKFRSNKKYALIDLPGLYNLSHPIDEEKVVAHEIYHEHFNGITNIIGAQSIERDLLLTLQCVETGLLNTLVINMIDEINQEAINYHKLSKYLNNVCVVSTQANRSKGIKHAEHSIINNKCVESFVVRYSETIETYIRKIENLLPKRKISNRFYAIMLLEGNEHIKFELQIHYQDV
jgi:ferrous iron transport protein B